MLRLMKRMRMSETVVVTTTTMLTLMKRIKMRETAVGILEEVNLVLAEVRTGLPL